MDIIRIGNDQSRHQASIVCHLPEHGPQFKKQQNHSAHDMETVKQDQAKLSV